MSYRERNNENDDKIKRENKSENKSVRKDNIENIIYISVRGRHNIINNKNKSKSVVN